MEKRTEGNIMKIVWTTFLLALVVVTTHLVIADNIQVTQGTGTVLATDVVTRNTISENEQVVKLSLGADGTHDGFARMGQQNMANSLAVVLPSDQSIGGGVEYTEGDTDATITGKAMMWEDTSNTLASVSAAKPLPVVQTGTPGLPTGAATSANQSTEITSLQLIDDVIATTGSAVPSKGAFVAGTDGTNARGLKTDSSGELQIDVLTLPNVTVGSALPAGTNAIGKLAANSGVDIGDVDVTSLPSIPAGNNNIGDVDIASIAAGNNNIGDVDVASLPALPAGSNTIGSVGTLPLTAGGYSIYRNLDLDETGVSAKGSAGQLYGYYICNRATTERFLKLYNKASAATVGTDTPVITIPLAAGDADKPTCANVGWDHGVAFSLGIAAGATTGIADANTGAPGANDIVVNLFYK